MFHPIAPILITAGDDHKLQETLLRAQMKKSVDSIRPQAFDWIRSMTRRAILTVTPLAERFRRACENGERPEALLFFHYRRHQMLISPETRFEVSVEQELCLSNALSTCSKCNLQRQMSGTKHDVCIQCYNKYYKNEITVECTPLQHIQFCLKEQCRPTTLHCNDDHSICYCHTNETLYLDTLINDYNILPVLSAHIGKNVWVEMKEEGILYEQYGFVYRNLLPVYRILQHSLVLRYYPEGLPEELAAEQKRALQLYGLWY